MQTKIAQTSRTFDPLNWLFGLVGAVLGGIAGHYVSGWIISQGFYGAFLPGLFAGIGCGFLARRRDIALAVAAGVIGLGFCIYSEWRHFPFIADKSFGYFLQNLSKVKPVSLIMIALGGLGAFWFGLGNESFRLWHWVGRK
jgi:hypothetical protein